MSEPVLHVEGLRTHFFTKAGVVKAVDDVSFIVNRGEVMGLVGESGSGKSMTGYSILGLVDPPGRIIGGQIVLDGIDVTKLSADEMRQIRGNRVYGGGTTHIPLKVNSAGMIPLIFASSMLILPWTISSYFVSNDNQIVSSIATTIAT